MSEADLTYKVMSLKSDLVRLYFILWPFDIFDAACVADHRRSSRVAGPAKRLDTEVPASKSMRNTHRSAGDRTGKHRRPHAEAPGHIPESNEAAPRSTGGRTREAPEPVLGRPKTAPRSTEAHTPKQRSRAQKRWRPHREAPKPAPRSGRARTRKHRGRVHIWRTRPRWKGQLCKETYLSSLR